MRSSGRGAWGGEGVSGRGGRGGGQGVEEERWGTDEGSIFPCRRSETLPRMQRQGWLRPGPCGSCKGNHTRAGEGDGQGHHACLPGSRVGGAPYLRSLGIILTKGWVVSREIKR